MDVAEQIVVVNDGRVEQTGPPRDLYEHPETEFVMSFVGPVNRLGSMFVRPHDVEIRHVPGDSAEEAMIERIVHLGFEVRVELTLANGDGLWAQITRAQAEELELEEGQIVYVRPASARVFDEQPTGIRRPRSWRWPDRRRPPLDLPRPADRLGGDGPRRDLAHGRDEHARLGAVTASGRSPLTTSASVTPLEDVADVRAQRDPDPLQRLGRPRVGELRRAARRGRSRAGPRRRGSPRRS